MEKYTTYDFKKVENTAQQFWSDSKLFEASESLVRMIEKSTTLYNESNFFVNNFQINHEGFFS